MRRASRSAFKIVHSAKKGCCTMCSSLFCINVFTLAGSPSQSKPVGFDSSPKGRALGSPRKLHLFAKASPFGRGGIA